MLPGANLPPSESSRSSLHDLLSDAIPYWERRRLAYNLVLVAVVIGCAVTTWRRFRDGLSFELLLALFVLGVLANVCYCAAYLADIPIQYFAFRIAWRRNRWMLWATGTLFAMALTYYWLVDEMAAVFGR
jgi:hypothetical protein